MHRGEVFAKKTGIPFTWLCIKLGRGQGDGDTGTRLWGLVTRGRETKELGTSSMGRGDVWDGDARRQIQGSGGRGMWMIIATNAISVTFPVNMFWWRQPTLPFLRVPPCLFTKQRLSEDPLHWGRWNHCPGLPRVGCGRQNLYKIIAFHSK